MKTRLALTTFACVLGLAALAQGEGADVGDESGATAKPAEIRRGVEMGASREERSRRFYERVIRKVEPSGIGDPAKLPQYVELFKREFVEDTRTFAFNVTATAADGGAVATSGWVEFDEHRNAMGQFLGHLGFKDVKNELQTLPDPALGDEAYAVVGDAPVFVYDKPAAPRETLTEALPGDGLFLLKDVGNGVFLCHVADGYVGYVEAAKVRPVSGPAFDAHLASRPASADRDQRVETAIAAAEKLLGTKYVWGGRTPAGIDCSGLVHTAFRAAGVSMPRDADQQSLVGSLVGTRWHRSALRRGDVLFFLGRRGTISHTGIYLGDGKFIEAAEPAVKVSELEKIREGRDKSRGDSLCFAKRVFE
jgi:cell wall-associated NlpC family hydrolase